MGNLTLKELGRRAFETAKAKGFHDEPIDIPRALMLTVSELAEALEADRKNKRADLSAFFDKEPCEIFPFREKFEVHVKDTFEDELADGLVVVCRRHNAKDSEGKTYPYLMELYQYIEQNADLCHVLLGKNGDIAFTDRICHILRDEFLYDFLAYYYPNDPAMLDYFCSFIVSGNMSLALTWIDGGMKQTAEEMAVLAGEIIMHGVKVLETKA